MAVPKNCSAIFVNLNTYNSFPGEKNKHFFSSFFPLNVNMVIVFRPILHQYTWHITYTKGRLQLKILVVYYLVVKILVVYYPSSLLLRPDPSPPGKALVVQNRQIKITKLLSSWSDPGKKNHKRLSSWPDPPPPGLSCNY